MEFICLGFLVESFGFVAYSKPSFQFNLFVYFKFCKMQFVCRTINHSIKLAKTNKLIHITKRKFAILVKHKNNIFKRKLYYGYYTPTIINAKYLNSKRFNTNSNNTNFDVLRVWANSDSKNAGAGLFGSVYDMYFAYTSHHNNNNKLSSPSEIKQETMDWVYVVSYIMMV